MISDLVNWGDLSIIVSVLITDSSLAVRDLIILKNLSSSLSALFLVCLTVLL